MFAKKTEENDESFEKTMDNKNADIFDTPRARCLKLKTEFLRKARNYKFWGQDKSRQRVIALDTVLRYCRQSIDLAEWGTELRRDVHVDIKNLLLENHMLPVPRSIREELLRRADNCWETHKVSVMMAELQKLCNDALAEFEKDEWFKREDFNQDSCGLRALRKKIYTGEKDGSGQKWVIGVLCEDIDEYEWQVKNFLKKYKKILRKHEIVIWKKKLKETIKYAKKILGPCFSDDEISENEEENPESLAQDEALDTCSADDEISEDEEDLPHSLDTDSSSIPVVTLAGLRISLLRGSGVHCYQLDTADDEAVTEVETFKPGVEVESIEPKVEEIFDATKKQELLVESLPNIPVDTDGHFDDHSLVDENIEARLLKLKFFRKTWCSSEPCSKTEPEKEAPPDVVNSSKPKRKSEVEEKVPTYTTKEEAEKFNDWYLQKNCAKSNISADALKNEVQATKVEQDETPIPVLGVFRDEEVDHDHTKELLSPSTRNLFKGSTSANTNPNMENLFVLLFAFIKLINFSCPKLSFVPAVFPTQLQPYPDQDTSVRSTAHSPTLASVEMRLTSTTSSRQVETSHMTRGYLSWLRDTVWGILQRGKISAGLRFIKVGEMLLA